MCDGFSAFEVAASGLLQARPRFWGAGGELQTACREESEPSLHCVPPASAVSRVLRSFILTLFTALSPP